MNYDYLCNDLYKLATDDKNSGNGSGVNTPLAGAGIGAVGGGFAGKNIMDKLIDDDKLSSMRIENPDLRELSDKSLRRITSFTGAAPIAIAGGLAGAGAGAAYNYIKGRNGKKE